MDNELTVAVKSRIGSRTSDYSQSGWFTLKSNNIATEVNGISDEVKLMKFRGRTHHCIAFCVTDSAMHDVRFNPSAHLRA